MSDLSDHEMYQRNSKLQNHHNIEIHLTSEEEQIFSIFDAAASAYEAGCISLPSAIDESNHHKVFLTKAPIQIRIAGGWVRDKLLHQDSHDIDVALDCMSGYSFATIVQIYLRNVDKNTSSSSSHHDPCNGNVANVVDDCKSHKIAVISANPSQSKHLETATMRIFGMDLDFVNLRAEEVYDHDSRIPTHQTRQFGTPLEDALRRDFTVNSMFYNVRSREIEDWTGRGVSDLLETKLLVTPLDPHITFHDDPLRVLRAIRFSVRYNLTLHPEIQKAAMSPRVHESLHLKVSRERVGKELDGLLTGKGAKPGTALNVLTQLKLAGSVFCFPPSEEFAVMGNLLGLEYQALQSQAEKCHARELGWMESTALIQLVPSTLDYFMIQTMKDDGSISTVSQVDVRIVYLSTFLFPFRHLTYLDKKNKPSTLITYIVRESIKFRNKDITDICTIMNNLDEFRRLFAQFKDALQMHNPITRLSPLLRLDIGLQLRNVRELWVTMLILVAVLDLHELTKTERFDSIGQFGLKTVTLDTFSQLYHTILNENLDYCWCIRPFLDGRELIKLLELTMGPLIAKYIDEQTRWMLQNPNGSRKECEEFLKQRKMEIDSETYVFEEENTKVVGDSTVDLLVGSP